MKLARKIDRDKKCSKCNQGKHDQCKKIVSVITVVRGFQVRHWKPCACYLIHSDVDYKAIENLTKGVIDYE